MRKLISIVMSVVLVFVIVSLFFLIDSDGDGLSNLTEIQHGTAYWNPDTDNDGLGDGLEMSTYRTDPLVSDTDHDGLSDSAELNIHGTGALTPDSDGDTLDDGLEVNVYGTSPLSADTDNDNLDDWVELSTYSTDPLGADTDHDNLSDFLEVTVHGTDPLDNDTDNDMISDSVEVNGWVRMVNGVSVSLTSSPFSDDSDTDNLSDWAEYNTYRSDPRSDDTDNDGLGDLLEVLYNTNLSDASSVAQLIENAPSYPRLFLEIDYMSGYAPAPEAISYLERYFEYDLGVEVEVVYDEVTYGELAAIGVSTESISAQELSAIESGFHDNPTTHLYVFYASGISEEESGGLSSPSFGVALYGEYLPRRLDRERTILLHEIGHAIGLQHSTDPTSVMQSGPTFLEPIYASAWDQRNLLDVWSVDEPWA